MLSTIKKLEINSVINYVAIAYAFSIPVSRAGIGIFSVLLFILWLIEGDFKDKFLFLKTNKVIVSIIAFIVYSLISLSWSSEPGSGLDHIRKYFYFLPILIIATSIQKDFLFRILSAFLFGMLISEILSYGIFFEWWKFKDVLPNDPTPFMNHLQYAMFLSMSSLLLLNRFFFETSLKWKLFYFIYFLTVTSNLFLNGGRTGHVAFAVSIFVVGFANIKNKFVAFFSMLLLVISIFYTAYNVSPVFQSRFDAGVAEANKFSNNAKDKYIGSFGIRLAMWKAGSEIIKERPILGTGMGAEMKALQENVEKSNYDSALEKLLLKLSETHYHNNYVQVTVGLGLTGLFLYLLILYQIFKLRINDRELSNLRYIFLAVYSISCLVELMFGPQFPLAFFALFVGIFIGFSKNDDDYFFSKNKNSVKNI